MKSLGFVEVSGVTAAVDALDIMCKSAEVSLVSWERKLGGRLVTLMVTGSVSAVQSAVDAAAAGCIKKPVAVAVIPNPHEETVRLVKLSASRLEKQAGARAAKAKKTETDDKAPAPETAAEATAPVEPAEPVKTQPKPTTRKTTKKTQNTSK